MDINITLSETEALVVLQALDELSKTEWKNPVDRELAKRIAEEIRNEEKDSRRDNCRNCSKYDYNDIMCFMKTTLDMVNPCDKYERRKAVNNGKM